MSHRRGDPYLAARQSCIRAINLYRAGIQLPPLRRWCEKTACVDQQAQSDARQNRAHASFGSCKEGGQNACPNWPLPIEPGLQGCLKGMWEEGPGKFDEGHGHYINMANPDFTQVECGFSASGEKFWALQDFS